MTKRFRITGRLLCADIRLATDLSEIVTQENRPTEAEAWGILNVAADALLNSVGAPEYGSELSEVTISGVPSEKKLVIKSSETYAQVRKNFSALWPILALELFIPDRNFYTKGSDTYASLLKDTDPLHVFHPELQPGALTIDGDMLTDEVRALVDRFWLQARVTVGDRGPLIPSDLSLDDANESLRDTK